MKKRRYPLLSENNIILLSDSYKVTHWKQIRPDITNVFSFFESRGGAYDKSIFFGLQYILEKYLSGVVVTEEKIQEAKEVLKKHFGGADHFNEAAWRHILNKHGGRLPIKIQAVPEGTHVQNHNVLMTAVNTDPEVPFITNYLETILSQVWYPTTVATQSKMMKETLLRYLKETGTPDLIDFKLHDFGFRGSTSVESSGIGGASHLVNFQGTDTLSGIVMARNYYDTEMPGYSIPAAEHFTITSWGREFEKEAYENMLNQFPKGHIAVVSDSYDVFNASERIWGEELRDKVLGREGTLVIRPDSGDPPSVVVKILNILGEKFGYEKNALGYKVLDPHIRVIQGDGIDPMMLEKVLFAMKNSEWSADNVAFGSGGGLLQKVNRDTLKFAFKCSAIDRGGVWYDVMKDPITDPGKRSKAGRLKLVKNGSAYKTERFEDSSTKNELQTVFLNGELTEFQNFDEIRERANLVL